ncbi:adrenocortical dysplasia protein homolog [Betta splendens]|uniref:Adrenocortical dysplasia protein homolog n=1 Tax=Betta splendens TaxID=158456 RepID=A0A6P7MUF8_BETSP|nr:adrenocortical dysplasia protein homolog [Betta splendens]XP_029009969.1 adrenocortical dysplasia protein homolog [Betta splendens]
MTRPSRSKLTPWIEQLIVNYGSQEAGGGCGRLKAHVIGVGQLSQSQAAQQACGGPSGLLFLSDGALQIPAVLTAAAWENLQEQEDRECFTSLVNSTVCIQDYRLQFLMAPEQTRCRFILSVGELATTAAGPVKNSTPCCTTLPSVRLKVIKTWKALQGVEESQRSQCVGADLSELLGEWQHDCLQEVLRDVRDRLTVASSCSRSPQPSTSAFTPAPPHPHVATATSWDVDRVRNKGASSFSVPIKCLLIPEEDASGLQTSVGGRSGDRKGPELCEPSGATQAHVDAAETALNSPPHLDDCTPHKPVLAGWTDGDLRPLADPWDIFPPPHVTSSSSDSCPEVSPPHSLHKQDAATPKLVHAGILTSTQLPVQPSEPSFIPPYQKPLDLTGPCSTLASSPSTKDHSACAEQTLKEESKMLGEDMAECFEETHGKAKRKRSDPTSRAPGPLGEEEAQFSGSPPSWLFETQAGRGAGEVSADGWGPSAGSRKIPTVHSDGKAFSYSYQVSGQNLQDFSRFRVDESLVQWAVKILVVPKQDALHASGNSRTDTVCQEQPH